jgi:uncharacterized protein YegL
MSAPSRRRGRVLALALVLVAGGVAVADGESVADRLRTTWTRADDAARDEMLRALAAAPTAANFVAARDAARSAAELLMETRGLKRKIEAYLAEQPPRDPKAKGPDPDARDRAEAKDLAKQAERDAAALARLAAACGGVLDALRDDEMPRVASEALRDAAKDPHPDLLAWAVGALAAAKRDRMPAFLLDDAAASTKDFRKAEGDRKEPARKVEEVNKKISDLLDAYLLEQQKAGDYSGKYPEGLLGTLPSQKSALERELKKIQVLVEAADLGRRGALEALGRWIATAPSGPAAAAFDGLERRFLVDADPEVRALGLHALGSVPGSRALERTKAALGDADPRVVVAALDALGPRTEPEAVDLAAGRLADPRWRVRAAAAACLADLGRAAGARALVEGLVVAKGRDLDDLRAALVRLTGRSFPAAPGPWATWWDAEGKDFRGPRESPVGGVAAKAGEFAGDEGGLSFYGIQTHSTRVLFVLDVSGSMNFPGSKSDAARKKIDVLREEVRRAITGLQDGSVFDIVLFSSSVRVWKKDPQVRGAKALSEALEFVNKAEVVGSTNVHDALETAFKMMGAGTTKDKAAEPVYDTLFFMTDGRPTSGKVTDPQLILGAVRRWNEGRKVRVHVVGAGGKKPEGAATPAVDDVDPAFLKALAEQNGGEFVLR